MDWLEFLEEIAKTKGLSDDEVKVLKATFPEIERKVKGNQVAGDLTRSESGMKGKLTKIYDAFEKDDCPKLAGNKNGKGRILHDYLRELYQKKKDEVKNQSLTLNTSFQALITEKTRMFCGRKFVFDAFEKFLEQHPKGYFTIVGYPGMGKSAIAAKAVEKYQTIHYFNILGNTSTQKFLESVGEQLITRYHLDNMDLYNLEVLIQKILSKIPHNERLIIIVDDLDEVMENEREGNILNLPRHLPDRVYFMLTRRGYTPEQKRLFVSPDVAMEDLDLRAMKYARFNRDDVKSYINRFLDENQDYKDKVQKWIKERSVTSEQFVETLAEKSEDNFMYLSYVLQDIRENNFMYLSYVLRDIGEGKYDAF
ncbi:MAG: NB-ARC domain-containing protein [Microcoleaceae cyanobacterium]|jgi:adenylate kinase family enzyme